MDAQGTQLETAIAIAKNKQHDEPRIQIRLDRGEQWRQLRQGGQVFFFCLTTDDQAFGEERLGRRWLVQLTHRTEQDSLTPTTSTTSSRSSLTADHEALREG